MKTETPTACAACIHFNAPSGYDFNGKTYAPCTSAPHRLDGLGRDTIPCTFPVHTAATNTPCRAFWAK